MSADFFFIAALHFEPVRPSSTVVLVQIQPTNSRGYIIVNVTHILLIYFKGNGNNFFLCCVILGK